MPNTEDSPNSGIPSPQVVHIGFFGAMRDFLGSVSWVLVGIGVLIAFICASIISDDSVVNKLSDPAVARGFLTYVIVLAFVGMIFMLGYQAFTPGGDDNQFRRAREVFGSLTGVLGTIVGFHFGIADKDGKSLEVAPRVEQGQYIAHITAGTAPYSYSLRSEPAGVVKEERNKSSTDGWIIAPITSVASKSKILLEFKDSTGKTGVNTTELPLKTEKPDVVTPSSTLPLDKPTPPGTVLPKPTNQ